MKNTIETHRKETPWKTKEEWYKYGIERKYNTRGPSSISRSEYPSERSWYNRGKNMKWCGTFPFLSKAKRWSDFETWKAYGIEMRYDERNPASICNTDGKDWYGKGSRKKWITGFPFTYKSKSWENFDNWKEYGLQKGFDTRSKTSLIYSKSFHVRKWYAKGSYRKWLDKFKFSGRTPWPNIKKWKEYGLSKVYDKRQKNTVKYSANNIERRWYDKGYRECWLADFPFEYLRARDIIARSPKLKYISTLPLSTAERAIIMRATKEFDGKDYSISDIQKKLPSKPRLNLGPLNLGRDGIYDIMVGLAHKAPEVYVSPEGRLAIMNRLNRYYYAIYPNAKHDPAAEEYVIRQAEKDFARFVSNVKAELVKQ